MLQTAYPPRYVQTRTCAYQTLLKQVACAEAHTLVSPEDILATYECLDDFSILDVVVDTLRACKSAFYWHSLPVRYSCPHIEETDMAFVKNAITIVKTLLGKLRGLDPPFKCRHVLVPELEGLVLNVRNPRGHEGDFSLTRSDCEKFKHVVESIIEELAV